MREVSRIIWHDYWVDVFDQLPPFFLCGSNGEWSERTWQFYSEESLYSFWGKFFVFKCIQKARRGTTLHQHYPLISTRKALCHQGVPTETQHKPSGNVVELDHLLYSTHEALRLQGVQKRNETVTQNSSQMKPARKNKNAQHKTSDIWQASLFTHLAHLRPFVTKKYRRETRKSPRVHFRRTLLGKLQNT